MRATPIATFATFVGAATPFLVSLGRFHVPSQQTTSRLTIGESLPCSHAPAPHTRRGDLARTPRAGRGARRHHGVEREREAGEHEGRREQRLHALARPRRV